jgi:hypothetical protein
MIPWWWLIITAMLTGSGGLILGAVSAAAGRADEQMEGSDETDKPKKAA